MRVRIEAVFGRGGMGVVYKAYHRQLKRTVALKMVRGGGPHALARFRIESEAVARLQHPNIVQIHEVGVADGQPYCCLEFVDDGTLARKLDRRPMPPRGAAKLVEAVARAVQLAHSRNVVHRDLKPANILLTADGAPKITDFGLARQTDTDSGETQAGQVMGTPSYMAPEQAAGHAHEAGPAADIYSLSAILYDCLAGPRSRGATVVETLDVVRTQEPVPPSRWQAGVPLDLDTVCQKCLRNEPENHYPSAADLADDLARYLRGEPILVGPVERAQRWCRRNPAEASLVAVLAGAVLLGVTGGAVQANSRAEAAASARGDAEEEKATAMRQKDKAERVSYRVATLLRVATLYETDPAEALALLQDADAIRPDLRCQSWGFYRNYCRRAVRQLPGRPTPAVAVAFSPDGTTLATACGADGWSNERTTPGALQLWNVAGSGEPNTLVGHLKTVQSVAFSPGGKTLASGSSDGKVKLWEMPTGAVRTTFTGHTGPVWAVAVSPDGKLVASAGWDQTIRVWDVATGANTATISGHAATAIAWGPAGRTLASISGGDGDCSGRRAAGRQPGHLHGEDRIPQARRLPVERHGHKRRHADGHVGHGHGERQGGVERGQDHHVHVERRVRRHGQVHLQDQRRPRRDGHRHRDRGKQDARYAAHPHRLQRVHGRVGRRRVHRHPVQGRRVGAVQRHTVPRGHRWGAGGGGRFQRGRGDRYDRNRLADFFAGEPNSRGGVRLAVKNLDGDNKADIVAGVGTGAGSKVVSYTGKALAVDSRSPAATGGFDALPGFNGGVFVG